MAVTHFDSPVVRPRYRGKRLFFCWLAAAALWLAVVCIGFCERVSDHVDATRDIGRELREMDCASGARTNCGSTGLADYEGSWRGTAKLFATFGFWEIVPIAVLPPLGLLVFGCFACGCSRALRRPMRPTQDT
jgi:hypothetical protein